MNEPDPRVRFIRALDFRHDHNDDVRNADALNSLRRVLRVRYVILALVAASSAVVAGGRGDWNLFARIGRSMLGHDGLGVLAQHGDAQTGPIALLAAAVISSTPRNGFPLCVVIVGVLGLLSLRLLEVSARTSGGDQRLGVVALLGGMFLAFAWGKLGGYGHLDDALVLTGSAGALCLARRQRTYAAAIVIGLSIAVKPWALMFVPLTMAGVSEPILRRWRPPVLALLIGGSIWAPFFIAAPATFGSLRPTVAVAPGSVLRLFGLDDTSVPGWLRVAQLALAMMVGLVAVLRGRPEGAILVPIAVRLATDPGTWSYYTPGFLLGALAWDLCSTRRVIPLFTVVGTILLAPTWLVPHDQARAVLRLLACGGAVVAVLLSERVPSSDPMHPKWDPTAID